MEEIKVMGYNKETLDCLRAMTQAMNKLTEAVVTSNALHDKSLIPEDVKVQMQAQQAVSEAKQVINKTLAQPNTAVAQPQFNNVPPQGNTPPQFNNVPPQGNTPPQVNTPPQGNTPPQVNTPPQNNAPQGNMPPQGTTVSYTLEEIMRASAQMISAKIDYKPLFARYGIEKLSDLPEDKYGAFALDLRQMGISI